VTVFDETTRTTRAVCWGLTRVEYRELMEYITTAKENANHFLFLPILLVDIGLYKLARFVESRRRDASYVQEDLGMDDYLDRRRYTDPLSRRIPHLNLDHATERLTSLSQSAVDLSCYCRAQQAFLLRVGTILAELKGESTPGLRLEESVHQAFKDRLTYLSHSLKSIQSEIDALQQSITGLVQTVSRLVREYTFVYLTHCRSTVSLHRKTANTVSSPLKVRCAIAQTCVSSPPLL
jgi:hypothetical protein